MNRLLNKNLVALLFLMLNFFSAQSQIGNDAADFWQNKFIAPKIHYGTIIPHRESIKPLLLGHTYAFEIDFMQQTDGSKNWHRLYHNPQTGFEFLYINFANPQIVGNAFGILYVLNFPITKTPPRQFSFRLGSGLGYLTKTFTPVENYRNSVISTHINAAIQLNFEERWKISERCFANLTFGITHFSNGAAEIPNLGINNGSLSAGLNYFISKEINEQESKADESFSKKISGEIIYTACFKQNSPPGSKYFFASTFSGGALMRVNARRNLGLGLDVFYDEGIKNKLAHDSVLITSNLQIIRSGIHFSHEQIVGKTSILLQMGMYFINPHNLDGIFYHRFGFKFDITKKLFANLTLKAHFGKADYIESGFGFKL